MSNAMKYSGERRKIWIETLRLGDHAKISIRDAGIGMESSRLSHIFEAFYRVEDSRSAGGAGLGLSIVKHTIDAHHGSIDVESQPGVGTIFTVHLPLSTTP